MLLACLEAASHAFQPPSTIHEMLADGGVIVEVDISRYDYFHFEGEDWPITLVDLALVE